MRWDFFFYEKFKINYNHAFIFKFQENTETFKVNSSASAFFPDGTLRDAEKFRAGAETFSKITFEQWCGKCFSTCTLDLPDYDVLLQNFFTEKSPKLL